MAKIEVSPDQNTVTVDGVKYAEFVPQRTYGSCVNCAFKKVDCSNFPCIDYSIGEIREMRKDGKIGYFKLINNSDNGKH
jgi:hypothetical protein